MICLVVDMTIFRQVLWEASQDDEVFKLRKV